MLVKGKYTRVEEVSVKLEDKEIDRIVAEQASGKLLAQIRKRMINNFAKGLVSGYHSVRYSPTFTIKESGPNSGVFHVVEEESNLDYHNNIYTDVSLRMLTDEEVEEYKEILNFPGHLGVYLL